MSVVITVLIVIAAILMVLIVLVQNSKGGGLASSFSSSNQIMGAPKTADFLEKATWFLAIFIIVLCIASAAFSGTHTPADASKVATEMQNAAPINTATPNKAFGEQSNPSAPTTSADSTAN